MGWGDSRGRETHKGGIIHTHIADSFCSTAETNNTVRQLHSNNRLKKLIEAPEYYISFPGVQLESDIDSVHTER